MEKVILAVPVYNEERILEDSITLLYSHLEKNLSYNWGIVIADNASTDKTPGIADLLQERFPNVKAMHIKEKGKGSAIKHAWMNSKADVYSFCDADLSADISSIEALVEGIIKEKNNIVIGSRYLEDSDAQRSLRRLIYSKVYISMVNFLFDTKIKDLQCGFKAVDDKVVREILPLIENGGWFFDHELVLKAESLGYLIKEIPIKWQENKSTKINVLKVGYELTRNLISLKRRIRNSKK